MARLWYGLPMRFFLVMALLSMFSALLGCGDDDPDGALADVVAAVDGGGTAGTGGVGDTGDSGTETDETQGSAATDTGTADEEGSGTSDTGAEEFGGPHFGDACESNEDCPEGWCVEGPDNTICTENCVTECPEAWTCKGVTTGQGGDLIFLCVPEPGAVCGECTDDAACLGATACRDGQCLATCEGELGLCKDGFECVDELCQPAGELPW